jgi:transcriptional regulator with XRE-family HTH domain
MSEASQNLKGIGERLQLVRKRLNLTQKDFAKELGTSGASLSEVEAGNAKPMIEIYYHITGKFDVNQDYLLFGAGDMFMGGDNSGISPGESDREYLEFMEKLLYYFKHSKLVRTAVMGHFTTFLLENEATIEKDMKKNKSRQL